MTARLFLSLLVLRIFNCLFVATYFQPDAEWQGLEIAHRIVFGYGYTTWEWRPENALRSPLGALVYVPPFALAELLGGHASLVVRTARRSSLTCQVALPRITQAIIAATNDWATWRLAQVWLPASKDAPAAHRAALICSITSLANAVLTARTFVNSLETALTALALSLWPWDGVKGRIRLALGVAALACIVRPSNAVIWLILGLRRLRMSPATGGHILGHVSVIAYVAYYYHAHAHRLVALLFCVALDSAFYGRVTFTPLNFLRVNVLHNISTFYGLNAAHFYFSQALPILAWVQLPFMVHGALIKARSPNDAARVRVTLAAIAAMIGMHTALAHKEFRFVQPLLSLLHVLAARSLSSSSGIDRRLGMRRSHFFTLCLASLVPAVYLLRWHGAGQVGVIDALRTMPEVKSVGFLMPCHSTPWQSRLHRPDLEDPISGSGSAGRFWFITCEPPVSGQQTIGYRDQSDFFYASPSRYLLDRFPSEADPSFPPSPGPRIARSADDDLDWRHEWPSHVVLFEALLDDRQVAATLRSRGYAEELRLFNSHVIDDERRRGDVIVMRWKSSSSTEP